MVLVRGSVHSQPQPCHAENHDVENLCKEPPDRLQDVIDAQAGTVIAGSGLMKPILAIQSHWGNNGQLVSYSNRISGHRGAKEKHKKEAHRPAQVNCPRHVSMLRSPEGLVFVIGRA